MNRHLRYEGPQLDEILARIRADHGDRAEIVSAELVRSGGIAGFFSKEHYEVTVVDPATKAPASTNGASSAADAPAAPAATVGTAAPRVEAAPIPVIDPAPVTAPVPAAPARAHVQDDVVRPAFAEMLTAMLDDEPAVDRVELSDGTAHSSPVELSERVERNDRAAAPLPRTGGLRRPSEVPFDDDSVPTELGDLCGAPVVIGELISDVTRRMRRAPELPADGVVAIVGARGDAVNAAVGVARSIGQLASDVLVAAPSADAVAPEHMAATVRATVRQRERRGRTGPAVVVVVVEPGRDGHRWATALLSILDAAQTRLALAGWRPVERLEQTIIGLGGVDAIDVVDLESAEHPDVLLDLDVPVATIDGEPASVEAWVAVLASHDPTDVVVVPPVQTDLANPSASGRTGHLDADRSASAATGAR